VLSGYFGLLFLVLGWIDIDTVGAAVLRITALDFTMCSRIAVALKAPASCVKVTLSGRGVENLAFVPELNAAMFSLVVKWNGPDTLMSEQLVCLVAAVVIRTSGGCDYACRSAHRFLRNMHRVAGCGATDHHFLRQLSLLEIDVSLTDDQVETPMGDVLVRCTVGFYCDKILYYQFVHVIH
jgi:hypothetical protein